MSTQLEPKQEQKMPMSAIQDMGFHSGPAFGLLRAAAQFLSESDIIPKQFQKNLANCAIALNMAQRMGADPLMVMQNIYVVYGRPGWSSQFLIATLNTSGKFSKLRYEWSDEKNKTKDGYGCRAHAIELETGEELYGPWVTVGLARSEGWYDRKSKDGGVATKWPTLTELMCMYRAAAFFVRTYCPEMAMGMRTMEEEEEIGAARNITDQGGVLERTPNMPPAYPGPIADQGSEKSAETAQPSASTPTNGSAKTEPVAPQAAPESQAKPKGSGKKDRPKAAPAPAGSTYSDHEGDPFAPGGDLFGREPGSDDQ